MRILRHGVRNLVRNPIFTLLVVITVAIGIGASTAIFSVVDAVLLRPLPYEEPERLVLVWNRLSDSGVEKSLVAGPDYVDYREKSRLVEDFAALTTMTTSITDDEHRPEAIYLSWASPNFFSLLGVDLVLGEMWGPEAEGQMDQSAARDPSTVWPTLPAVLSYGLWQRRYGGDPGVLGRNVVVNGQSMVVVGVAPPGFRLFLPADAPLPERSDVWSPFVSPLRRSSRTTQWIGVIGRLKPGIRVVEAQEEMDRIAAWQREHFEFHHSAGIEIRVIPMHEDVTRNTRPYLVWFLVAAGLLLVLSFSNVTNLLLVRHWGRRREISIRAALGGRPRGLMALLQTETLLLALLGGGLGLVLAHWGIRLLLALQPRNLPRVEEAGVDARMLAVGFGVALFATLVCGLASAFQASRSQLAATLTQRSTSATPSQQWLRKGLVVAEIVISLVLLIMTGLLFRSFGELSRIAPGFDPGNVLTAKVSIPLFGYLQPESRARFFAELVRRAGTIPGVGRASGAVPTPLEEGRQAWWGPWSVEGMNIEEWSQNEAEYRATMPGYFETMGIELLQGRRFTAADNEPDAPPVAIVDEVFARRAWPGEQNPVGKRLAVCRWGARAALVPVWAEVVGMVRHVRDDDLTRDGIGSIYCPFRHFSFFHMTVTLKSAGADPRSLIGPLREILRELDPNVPLTQPRLMQEFVDDFFAPTRFALRLMGIFAVIATLLAAVGLYGVISSAVQQRSHEIGVRMAFGAARANVVRMVLGQSLVLAFWGLGLGLLAAALLTRGLSSMLYGITATDPVTFVAVALLQVFTVVLASLVPAWRATRIDPVTVLNTE